MSGQDLSAGLGVATSRRKNDHKNKRGRRVMRKPMLSSIAVAVCLMGLVLEGQGMGATKVKQLSDLNCAARQTVFFDGVDWVCVDFPPGVPGLQRVQATTPFNTVSTKSIDAVC